MDAVPADGIPLVTETGRPCLAMAAELLSAGVCTLAAVACDAAMKALTPEHHTLGWRVAMPDGLAHARGDGSIVVTLAVAPPLLEAVILLALSDTPPHGPRADAAPAVALRIHAIGGDAAHAVDLDAVPAPTRGTAVQVGVIRRDGERWTLHQPAVATRTVPVPVADLPQLFAVLLG